MPNTTNAPSFFGSGYVSTNGTYEKLSPLENADFSTALNNYFSGNLDYQRELNSLDIANTFNANEAQKARDWQEYMSNTSHQREMADLAAAGFNPALGLGTGGATGYSGAVASSSSPHSHSSGSGFGAVASGLVKLISLAAGAMVSNARQAEALNVKQEIASNKLDYLYDKLETNAGYNDAFLEAKKQDLLTKERFRQNKWVQYQNDHPFNLNNIRSWNH